MFGGEIARMAFFLSVILRSVVDMLRPASSSVVASPGLDISLGDHENVGEKKHRVKSKCCFCVNMSWMSRFVGSVLKWGSVPRHIALILDGNRRFAVKNQLARKTEGHALGFEKLHEALEWAFDAGVAAVTVYAFSIENFRRPADEVETLMALAQEKFEYMLTQSELLRKNQVVIRVWGDLSLLPASLQALVGRVTAETQGNAGPALNVCFPFTSSHDVVRAARELQGRPVSAAGLERALFSRGDHPELLIRTSGEARLSDFLCWQTGRAHFLVYKCLWPEFTLLHFAAAVILFRFQKLLHEHKEE